MDHRKLTIYILIISYLIFTCVWDRINNIPKFPFNFFYVTQWCLYLNMIYFTYVLYRELRFGDSNKSAQKLYNYIFSISFLVGLMFWVLFLIQPRTLYKKGVKVPLPLNVSLHGGVSLCNFIELFNNKRKNPVYVKWYVYVISFLIYTVLLKVLYYFWKIIVYPFAHKNNLLLLGVNTTSLFVAMLGHLIYVWATTERKEEKEENEKELLDA